MRDHFCNASNLEAFKSSSNSDVVFRKIKIIFQIFCYCRFTWAWCDSKDKDPGLARYDSCKEWYHRKCENIRDIAFDQESDIHWDCFTC